MVVTLAPRRPAPPAPERIDGIPVIRQLPPAHNVLSFMPDPEGLESPVGRSGLLRPVPTSGPTRLSPACPPAAADVVVIGGGPAAVALAARLRHAAPQASVLICDPAASLGERFFARLASVGQSVLRSPYEHHVGVEGARDCEMIDFARFRWAHLTSRERGEVRRALSGQRAVVPLDVFAGFFGHVVAGHALDGLHLRRRVASVHVEAPGRFRVVLDGDGETLAAKAVVWAVGEEALPGDLSRAGAHAPFCRWDSVAPGTFEGCSSTLVVGGGLSAASLVARALRAGVRDVTWALRGPLRFRCADVNAAYFRPEGRAAFRRGTPSERLALLGLERSPSAMLEFIPLIEGAVSDGRLRLSLLADGASLEPVAGGARVALAGGAWAEAQLAVPAFGLRARFSPPLFDESGCDPVRTAGGLPILDDTTCELVGVPGAFATGALASLAVGPAGRNIDGIRIATEGITECLSHRL